MNYSAVFDVSFVWYFSFGQWGVSHSRLSLGTQIFNHNELGGVERYRQPCLHLVSCEFILLLRVNMLRLDFQTCVLSPNV